MSKLQILSPISDKSQEQTSSHSCSPQEQEQEGGRSLPTELWGVEEWQGRNQTRRRNRDLNLNLTSGVGEQSEHSLSFKNLRTPDIQQLLNVPWDVPKLKKKLQNRNFCFRGQTSSPETSPKRTVHPKSPDVETLLSGGFEADAEKPEDPEKNNMSLEFRDFSEVTPCTTVKTPELEAYLEVPWEVPKLRKKLQNRKKTSVTADFSMQGSDSGISMSSQETKEGVGWCAPKLRRRPDSGRCRPGSGDSPSAHRHTLCLTQPGSVAANAEFLVQSYPGPRPLSMVSSSMPLSSSSATNRDEVSNLVNQEGDGPEKGRLGMAGEEIEEATLERLRPTCSSEGEPGEGRGEGAGVQGGGDGGGRSNCAAPGAPAAASQTQPDSGGDVNPVSSRETPSEHSGAPSFGEPAQNSDISDLPFLMPKLARRLAQGSSSSPPQLLKLPKRPLSGLALGPPPDPQPKEQAPLSLGGIPPCAKYSKQPRPSSLLAPSGSFKLPNQRPGI